MRTIDLDRKKWDDRWVKNMQSQKVKEKVEEKDMLI